MQLIKDGVITRDTMIRNNMLATFSPAGTHQSLKNAFVRTAPEKLTRRRGETDYEYRRRVDSSLTGSNDKNTAFVREMNIVSGNLGLRILAAMFDLLILLILLIAAWGTVIFMKWDDGEVEIGHDDPARGQFFEIAENPTSGDLKLVVYNRETQTRTAYSMRELRADMTLVTMGWAVLAIFYYIFSLGYFAQTLGMWFYGLVLVKNDDEDDYEINYAMAARFFVAMIFLGWLTPATCLFTQMRGVHCLVTGCKVAGVGVGRRY